MAWSNWHVKELNTVLTFNETIAKLIFLAKVCACFSYTKAIVDFEMRIRGYNIASKGEHCRCVQDIVIQEL